MILELLARGFWLRWVGMAMTRSRGRAWCRSRGLLGHRCVFGIECIGMCGSLCFLPLVKFSTRVNMVGGEEKLE